MVENNGGMPPAQPLVQAHANKKVHLSAIRMQTPWLDPNNENANDLIEAAKANLPETSALDLNGKTICGIVLSIKHGTGTKYKVFERNNYSQFNQNIAAKRQRVAQTAPYDRLIMCGDISGPEKGSCFALVFQTHSDSRQFLRYVCNDFGVGSVIYIGEPKKKDKMLGDSMPIITPRYPIQPVSMTNTQGVVNFCPVTTFKIPASSGETRYFMCHGQTIQLLTFNLIHENVSCSGRYCDRSVVLPANVACGCMSVGLTRTPVVGEFSIQFSLREIDIDGSDKEFTVHDYRSLRTTEIFFRNLSDYSTQEGLQLDGNTRSNRTAITQMMNHVNGDGGWSICGWFRKGDIQDASTQEQKVDNDEVTMHISLLVPTAAKYANKTDNVFRGMLIRRE